MTIATQASAVEYKFKQIFSCEVVSQAYTYIEEGKLKSHKAEAFEGKVTFSISSARGFGERFELKLRIEDASDGVFQDPFVYHDSNTINEVGTNGLRGGDAFGLFELSDDKIKFVNSWGSGLYLKRYYKSDFSGMLNIMETHSMLITYGLNCLSTNLNIDVFRNLYDQIYLMK